ncbi:MAG TPA: hypothetical protein VKE74_17510 [Gemmataceae bacterium]|nr:hypothetical protein [Gemmataceae bacterium]
MSARTPDEAGFTQAVIQLARLHGWRCAHFRAARTVGGWRTPVSGDVGFPDLVLARRERLVVAELKIGRGRPTDEQSAWLSAFTAAGVQAFIWTPELWTEIEETLS